jgi:hypothetical protein
MKHIDSLRVIGERGCATKDKARLSLINHPMSYLDMIKFYDHVKTLFPNMPEIYIRNMNKGNARLHGTFFFERKEIRINRSCVLVLLHELSHVIQRYHYKDCGTSHSSVFCNVLDHLIYDWVKLNKEEALSIGLILKGEQS